MYKSSAGLNELSHGRPRHSRAGPCRQVWLQGRQRSAGGVPGLWCSASSAPEVQGVRWAVGVPSSSSQRLRARGALSPHVTRLRETGQDPQWGTSPAQASWSTSPHPTPTWTLGSFIDHAPLPPTPRPPGMPESHLLCRGHFTHLAQLLLVTWLHQSDVHNLRLQLVLSMLSLVTRL